MGGCIPMGLSQNAITTGRNAGPPGVIQSHVGEPTGGAEGDMMNMRERAGTESRPSSADDHVTDDHAGRERDEEARKIRRLQVMMSMVMSVIGQDPSLTIDEASEMAARAKSAALAMFPDKELAYDLLYKPRLQRLMRERFRLQ